MLHQSDTLSQYRFRPALPCERRQIRLLLRTYHNQEVCSSGRCSLKHYFCLGLLLALGLHGLVAVGGVQLLLYGGVGLGTVALIWWLNLWLFEDWRNYWVIEQGNQLIACAKLTHYRTYSVLCDVTVAPNYRRQGIGTLLVESITQTERQPLYLACKPKLVRFYQRLGFVAVNPCLLSVYLRHELGLSEEPGLMPLRLEQLPQPPNSLRG
jgi:GNAT superfamily N-acetyltransferase